MTAVFGVSVIQNGVRHSFNAQHKNSIDAYCHRLEESRDLMQRIKSFVDTCKPTRKGLSQGLFHGDQHEFVEGIPCIVNPPNLDPSSFSQTNMDSVVRLSLKFSLSFPEIVSLLLGMETLPHQTYLSRVATLIMSQSPNDEKKKFPRGPLFGCCFAQILQSVFNTYQGLAGFRWYNYYVPRALPSSETWEGIVKRRMHMIMNLWKDYPERPSKQQAISVMKSFTRDIERTNVGTGKLASNHITLVMSILGITPPWTADFAVITDKAKSIEWFNNQFAMKKLLKGVELE